MPSKKFYQKKKKLGNYNLQHDPGMKPDFPARKLDIAIKNFNSVLIGNHYTRYSKKSLSFLMTLPKLRCHL